MRTSSGSSGGSHLSCRPTPGWPAQIVDRYVRGTRLRLRRVRQGDELIFKLAQKICPNPADPEVVKLTNLYLSGDEYDVLAALPADEVRKTRWYTSWNWKTIAIDQFHGRLNGLLLGEVDLQADEALLPPPPFVLRDVTHDDRFSGGALAAARTPPPVHF